ncbi:hypothetical protein QTP88_003192 [Uroleucon formosanum]
MSQRKASEHFKIPRSTIKKKLKKKKHGNSIGHPTVFSRSEELSFEQHCITLANFGFPLIPYDLKLIISCYLEKEGVRLSTFKNNIPGTDCVNGFLKKHPNLSVKIKLTINLCVLPLDVEELSTSQENKSSSLTVGS